MNRNRAKVSLDPIENTKPRTFKTGPRYACLSCRVSRDDGEVNPPLRQRDRNLQHGRFPRILRAMEIHLTPEQEAQLAQIATQEGTDAERLVKDAAVRLLEEDARFRAAVREGIAQADRGEFIEEEMDARLEQMLRS
jgi:predicted transcriptional regulator